MRDCRGLHASWDKHSSARTSSAMAEKADVWLDRLLIRKCLSTVMTLTWLYGACDC